MFRFAIALFALLPVSVLAQTSTIEQSGAVEQRADDRWTLGIAVSSEDSPYAGEGMRTRPFPFVTYQGGRIYWVGATLGVKLWETERFRLDANFSGRFDGFDSGDLGRAELAANGVDIDRLEDRDHGADAGLAARWELGGNDIIVRAMADITDTSEGYEVSADFGRRFRVGRVTLAPGIGVQWLSDDLADYYYGVRSTETFSGLAYQPDSAVIPRVSLGFAVPLGQSKWRVQGLVQYRFLPDELSDSPLLEPDSDGVAHVVIGVVRGF